MQFKKSGEAPSHQAAAVAFGVTVWSPMCLMLSHQIALAEKHPYSKSDSKSEKAFTLPKEAPKVHLTTEQAPSSLL